MKQLFSQLLVLTFVSFFAFCSKKDKPNPADPAAKPNTVSGIVKDEAGNPVAGAKIRAENPTGNNIHIDATSDAQGKYSVQLTSIGGWKIYAWKEVEFMGMTYNLRMGMENDSDYDAFSTADKGVIRNFVWRLDGRIPDRTVRKEDGAGTFGGTIKFINYNDYIDEMPPGTIVSVTFTPSDGAKYLDGSSAAGKVYTRKFGIQGGVGQAYYIDDMPVTQYIITATTEHNGIERQAYFSGDGVDFYEGFEYVYPSAGTSQTYESGIGSPNEHSFYILHIDDEE